MDSLMIVTIMLYLLNMLGKYIAELKATYFTKEEHPQSKQVDLKTPHLRVDITPAQINLIPIHFTGTNLEGWRTHTKKAILRKNLLNKRFINKSFVNLRPIHKRFNALPRGHPYLFCEQERIY